MTIAVRHEEVNFECTIAVSVLHVMDSAHFKLIEIVFHLELSPASSGQKAELRRRSRICARLSPRFNPGYEEA